MVSRALAWVQGVVDMSFRSTNEDLGEFSMYHHNPRDYLTDIRDGLTHRERIVLRCLYDLQQERGGRNVPTGMLYGTVVEHVDMSVEELQSILVRLIGQKRRS
jgi:hypothetical protein